MRSDAEVFSSGQVGDVVAYVLEPMVHVFHVVFCLAVTQ